MCSKLELIDNHSHLRYNYKKYVIWGIIMYICICNAVTEKDIKNEIKSGACTLKDLCSRLKVGNVCGSCSQDAENILEEILPKADTNNHL